MPRTPLDFAARGRQVGDGTMAGLEEWRVPHPKATLQEIAAAVDACLAERRTCMLEDVGLTSEATDVSPMRRSAQPVCPHCGTVGEPRGSRERQVTTHQAKTLGLTRSYMVGPTCQVEFSPLGEELETG
jgi:hypothetical protein